MGSIFPTYPAPLINPVKGKGSFLWDKEGNKYLDFTSGIGVCQLGHVPQKVKEEIEKQLNKVWHTSNLFTIEPQNLLAEKLAEISGLDYVFFANSGAEANEAAIKLARRYQQKVKKNNRYRIITFNQSFHGRTLATLTATGQEKVKEGYQPLPQGFLNIPYGDLESLKNAVTAETAAIMLEVVQGEGGIHAAEIEWLTAVEQIVKEQDLLLIIDEVQTGIGRTGEWFGFQNYPIKPDVITLAKGLANGIPIGAMLGSQKTVEAFSLGSHGSTFGGNFIATTAGLATLQTIEEEAILEKVKYHGEYMKESLMNYLQKYPELIEIRGKGLMIGIEWSKPVSDLVNIAKNNGLLVLTAGANVLRLLPPLNVSKDEIDYGLELLVKSIYQWLNGN